jgi:hypothetical protein
MVMGRDRRGINPIRYETIPDSPVMLMAMVNVEIVVLPYVCGCDCDCDCILQLAAVA